MRKQLPTIAQHVHRKNLLVQSLCKGNQQRDEHRAT